MARPPFARGRHFTVLELRAGQPADSAILFLGQLKGVDPAVEAGDTQAERFMEYVDNTTAWYL